MASACVAEGGAYIQCRALDTTGSCAACTPIDFETIQATFPNSLKQKFMLAMSIGPPDSPEFCSSVETNICADYEAAACCCEPEMAEWQKCVVAKDFSVQVGQSVPCEVSCATETAGGGGAGGGGGGGGMNMAIIVVILLILIAGGGGGYFFYRKRQANNSNQSKSKGKSKKKSSSDDSVDDSFQDEKNDEKPKKKGFFSMFTRGSENSTGSDTDSEDSQKRKKKGSKSPKSKKGKNQRDFDDDVPEDIEGGIISDVSSHGANRKKRYEEQDDSISDGYGGKGYNKRGSKNRTPYDSRSPFDDDVSELDNRDLEPRRTRSQGGTELPNRIRDTKKISSRELKSLMREKEESERRMSFIEEEMKTVEDRLARKDREANDLRRDRDEQARHIRELEAMNARLQEGATNRGGRGRSSGHNGGRGGDDDNYQDNNYGNGFSSRSKASISGEEDGPYEDRRGGSNRNMTPRTRGNSSKSLGRRSRSNSNRDLRRSNSGRSLGREGPRRAISRSPSSSRGLGKQASSIRRERSREGLDRGTSHKSTSRSHQNRSKSPRSYLREHDP